MKNRVQKILASLLLVAIITTTMIPLTVDSATRNNARNDFSSSSLDIVRHAATFLGITYTDKWDSDGPNLNYNITYPGTFNCSGLVWRTLSDLGYKFSPVRNTYANVPRYSYLPRHTFDWYYTNSNGTDNTVSANTTVSYNGKSNKVNVMLSDGTLDDYKNACASFPMGTIVVAAPEKKDGSEGHMWIFLGKLGNSKDEALKKLKSYGIINNNGSQDKYVKYDSTHGDYWVIDCSSGKTDVSEKGGVMIKNYDGTYAGANKKSFGSYFAYQIANQPTFSGSYHVNLGKKDRDNPDGDYVAGVQYTVEQTINNEKKSIKCITENKLKNITGEVSIKDITKYDNYIFGEKHAEDAGYATVGGTYGINVYKTMVNQKYTIEKIIYYSGSGDNLKKQEIKPGEKYWILSSRDAVLDSKVTDEQKKNSISYIELSKANTDGTVGAFTYVGLNKSIKGTYHMNIAKKSTSDDSELSDKSKALGNTTFKVTKTEYGQQAETKEVTTTDGEDVKSIFGDVDIEKNELGVGKPDVYTIDEVSTKNGYKTIDLSDISISVYKAKVGEKYQIDYVRVDKGGKEIGRAASRQTKDGANVNGEQTFDIDGDGVYDIGLEVSNNGMAFCITIRNPEKEGKYNVKLIKTDLLGNPLSEKETKFTINDQEETTVNGEITLATEKAITEDGQKDEYKIKESSAPEGFELYTGEVNLTAVGKELDEGFELDEENTKLTVDGEELAQGEVSKDGYVTWSLDGNTITIKVKNGYFDLALRKWVTEAIVTENGKTVVTKTGHKAEDDPEEIVKVDLRKSKLNDVTVKFRYNIRVTNEGQIDGEATRIRDDIPEGLKFVPEDNPDWRVENGKIVTDKLAGTTLKTGESAEVEILLTWVNSETNMGVLINTAEIDDDHNAYGVPDRDSTPGNNVPGEDDIDDAPVMVTVKTGNELALYLAIILGTALIVIVGIVIIKKKVLVDWE